MRFLPWTLALLALLTAAGCGNDAAPPGGGGAAASGKSVAELLEATDIAVQAEDWAAAIAACEGVLEHASAGPDDKAKAWMEKVRAIACKDGDDSGIAAVAAMDSAGIKPAGPLFVDIGVNLANNDHATVALELLKFAKKVHGDDKLVKKSLKRVAEFCQRKFAEEGDAGKLDQLNSLGYLGSSDDEDDEEEDGDS